MSLDVTLILNGEDVYSANITHNLTEMADNAKIYRHLWRPEEVGISKAKEMIQPLIEGLMRLHNEPEYFKSFNSPNGWGTYENFITFVEKYVLACIQYQEASIDVCR